MSSAGRDSSRPTPGAVHESATRQHDTSVKARQLAILEQLAHEAAERDARRSARTREVLQNRLDLAADKWGLAGIKPDAEAVLASADRHGVRALFHVTDAGNLASIMSNGIASRDERELHGIRPSKVHAYGGNAKVLLLSGFVGLSIVPHRGMVPVVNGVILACHTAPLARRGTFFVPGNTARNDVDVVEAMSRTSVDDFGALFDRYPGSGHLRDWQSEVWIPQQVEPDLISAVIFPSSAKADEGREIAAGCQSDPLPEVLVMPSLFSAPMWSPPVLPVGVSMVGDECPF